MYWIDNILSVLFVSQSVIILGARDAIASKEVLSLKNIAPEMAQIWICQPRHDVDHPRDQAEDLRVLRAPLPGEVL